MRAGSIFAFAAALGALSGCILFVNDDSYGGTCKFQGSDTACGKCVASACASELDKCCGDSTCEPSLTWLDDCVSEDDPSSCQTLASSAPDLVTCLESKCGACPGSDAGVESDAGLHTFCDLEDGFCVCSLATGPATGGSCTPATVTPGLCCAQNGWPSASTTCTCETFSCSTDSEGATCSLTSSPTGLTSYSGATCCADGTSCDCEDDVDTCFSGEPVDVCTVAAIDCDSDSYPVNSCSF